MSPNIPPTVQSRLFQLSRRHLSIAAMSPDLTHRAKSQMQPYLCLCQVLLTHLQSCSQHLSSWPSQAQQRYRRKILVCDLQVQHWKTGTRTPHNWLVSRLSSLAHIVRPRGLSLAEESSIATSTATLVLTDVRRRIVHTKQLLKETWIVTRQQDIVCARLVSLSVAITARCQVVNGAVMVRKEAGLEKITPKDTLDLCTLDRMRKKYNLTTSNDF
jgi:hypothetical protein